MDLFVGSHAGRGMRSRVDAHGLDDDAELATCRRKWLVLDRGIARAIGLEGTESIRLGRFTTPSGLVVDIMEDQQIPIASTVSVPPEHRLAPPRARDIVTSVDVANEIPLRAAAPTIAEGRDPLLPNKAHGLTPGFLRRVPRDTAACPVPGPAKQSRVRPNPRQPVS